MLLSDYIHETDIFGSISTKLLGNLSLACKVFKFVLGRDKVVYVIKSPGQILVNSLIRWTFYTEVMFGHWFLLIKLASNIDCRSI